MRTTILGSITSLALLTAAGLLGGCALVAGYDFSRYSEGTSEAGSSGSSSSGAGGATSSSSSAGGAGGSGGAATTSSTGGGGATSSSSGAGGSLPTTVLYEGPDPTIALAVDTTSVYFTTGKKAIDDSRLFRVEKDGTMQVELANSQPYLEALALDPMLQFAYWSSNKGGNGTLRRVSTAGGVMPQLIFMPLERVGGIAFSSGNLYWTTPESGYVFWRTAGNGINFVVKDQSFPRAIVADDSNIYWVNSGKNGSADGTVAKADLGGQGPTALANGQNSPDQIAISTTRVYWSNADGGVYSVHKNGTGSISTYMSPQAPPASCNSLAADETQLYFARGSTVYRALAGMSNPATAYVTELQGPLKIAIDATALYVAGLGAGSKGTVIKVPR